MATATMSNKEPNPYLEATRRIVARQTVTFAELAERAGRPAAARAAGRAVASCALGAKVPWHRVVAADGSLAAEPDRAARQLRRLRAEGARPREGESIAAWARRVRASIVGRWRGRIYARSDDPRTQAWPPTGVEAFDDVHEARERGFTEIDAPRAESNAPRVGIDTPRARRNARAPRARAAEPGNAERSRPEASIVVRLMRLDWPRAIAELEARRVFTAPAIFTREECQELRARFDDPESFERTVAMGPRGYGIGTYRYFREPLPAPALDARAALYENLRGLAGRARGATRYPPTLAEFWKRCREHGQHRSSSILLRYTAGGVNHLHRDIYGSQWFPYQAVVVLSARGAEFDGGEFVLAEKQSGGAKVERELPLDQGDLCIFGSRGFGSRAGEGRRWVELEHGMRTVVRGERFALGIVFHLAE